MVIVSVSEGEEKTAVAFEVEGHHSLETPGWETGRDQEARKVGGNAAGVVFAPSWVNVLFESRGKICAICHFFRLCRGHQNRLSSARWS